MCVDVQGRQRKAWQTGEGVAGGGRVSGAPGQADKSWAPFTSSARFSAAVRGMFFMPLPRTPNSGVRKVVSRCRNDCSRFWLVDLITWEHPQRRRNGGAVVTVMGVLRRAWVQRGESLGLGVQREKSCVQGWDGGGAGPACGRL